MNIRIDHRERNSGIIELLKEKNIRVYVKHLSLGDYLINNNVTVERKTAKDFLVSIITKRLFRQLNRLRAHADNPVILIEGDLFRTGLKFTHRTIRGTLLSIKTVWSIPVIFSKSKQDTAEILAIIGRQDDLREKHIKNLVLSHI